MNKRTVFAVFGILMVALIAVGIGLAQGDGEQMYTGCLNAGGQISGVAIGDQPLRSCVGSDTQISWSQTGPAGIDGLHCWDLNGDGVANPEENVNGDLVIDVHDCKGPQGEQGIQGLPGNDGLMGPKGDAGIACWDLNGNGIDDPGEDTSGDGLFDANDCIGPQGAQGIQGLPGNDGLIGPKGDSGLACWDLNGDGVQDSIEDITADGLFNAEDCQGPQGEIGPAGPSGSGGVAPSGAVMFFDLASCPDGWSELTDAQGRVLVGLPSGGTRNGTVGDPLTDLENRTHKHNVDIPTQSTAWSSHDHDLAVSYETLYYTVGVFTKRIYTDLNILDDFDKTTGDTHRHSVDVPPRDSTDASTSSVIPYIQLLVCEKD